LDLTSFDGQGWLLSTLYLLTVLTADGTDQFANFRKIWEDLDTRIKATDTNSSLLDHLLGGPMNSHFASLVSRDVGHVISQFRLRVTLQIMLAARSRLFSTTEGYIGVAPKGVETGDVVCVLSGCRFPVLLRNAGMAYVHVGPCFVLGLMDGEAAQLIAKGEVRAQEFLIQ
jgi:hypothetical protein